MKVLEEEIDLNDSHENNDGFKYLLVALFLAILAFFIMLNSLSEINKDKTEKILSEVREEFKADDAILKFLEGLKKEDISLKNKQIKQYGLKEILQSFLTQNSDRIRMEFFVYEDKILISIDESVIFLKDEHEERKRSFDFFEELSKILIENANLEKSSVQISYHFIRGLYEFHKTPKSRLSSIKRHFDKNDIEGQVDIEMGFVAYSYDIENFVNKLKILIELE